MSSGLERRPLATRERAVAKRVAARLVRSGVSANAISLSSVGFAAAAAGAFVGATHLPEGGARLAWLGAAACVQLRLLANMFDGMVALARGSPSAIGELYNEVPDRIADPLVLAGAGFAPGADPLLGALAAAVALFVAYVRALGASLGAGQLFLGPLAKPQRMFLVTLAALVGVADPGADQRVAGLGPMGLALAAVALGGAFTAWRRLARIAAHLRAERR